MLECDFYSFIHDAVSNNGMMRKSSSRAGGEGSEKVVLTIPCGIPTS